MRLAPAGARLLRLWGFRLAAGPAAGAAAYRARRGAGLVVAHVDARRLPRAAALSLSPVRHRNGALARPRSDRRLARRSASAADREPAIARAVPLCRRDRPSDVAAWPAAVDPRPRAPHGRDLHRAARRRWLAGRQDPRALGHVRQPGQADLSLAYQ